MSPLAAERLTLAPGGVALCRDLTLSFGAGENWAILGANGSGKTSLLLALAGLRRPQSGRVLLDGRELPAVAPRARARRLGIMFQDSELAFGASVLETALSGRHPYVSRWSGEDAADLERTRAALQCVGLEGFETRLAGTLSGGERRRADIATLLTQDPPICLWDEPSNHLDLGHQTQILAALAARARRPGHLNIFVLHDVNLAARVCSHGLLLLPSGEHLTGPLNTLLDGAVLGRMYGCAIRELRVDGRWLFMPE